MSACERYQPTQDQFALATVMGDALEALLPIQRLHDQPHETEDAWGELATLGVFGISRSEEDGGSGLGPAEEALVALELGRRLASPAVFATLGVDAACAPGTVDRVAAAWTEGDGVVMAEEPNASNVLIRDADGVRLVSTMAAERCVDEVHWSARLMTLDAPPGVGDRLDEKAGLRLQLFNAAALAGLSGAALAMAVQYAGFREQFGRPIGAFQAVKHHCADMALAAGGATDLVTFAAVALAEEREDAPELVDSALAVAGLAAVRNAALNVQIHGGVGFSDEADPHLLVKRARLYLAAAGGVDAALERLAAHSPSPDRDGRA